jgi:TolA-binding protein
MKLLPIALLAAPVVALSCGSFFYPAPPTLDRFPERLPVKTMRELLKETHPPPADAATFHQLSEETRAIAAALGIAPRDELLPRIDATLSRNRAGDYRKRFANCLLDLRDVLANEGAPSAEISAYAAWRAEAMDWDDGFFKKPPPSESWQFTPEQLAEMRRVWEQKLNDTAQRLAAEAAKAAPALKPHWLVQAGAWQFKHARFDDAARLFQQVIDEAPQHLRAEVARLMLARARIEKWRTQIEGIARKGEPETRQTAAALTEAEKALDAYLAVHPTGRFARDIPGWRGGIMRDRGYPVAALEFFLKQIDFTDHPEIVRRAVRECEICLEAFDAAEMEETVENTRLPLEEIARRPLAALAVVYHFLDSGSRRDFDDMLYRLDTLTDRDITEEYLPPVLRMRRAGREILPALAQAVASQKENYGGSAWRPKYLTVLAWAASEAGDHRQAVRVCDLAGPALEQSDDLLFVRAVALQRAGELDAAIAAFRHVLEKFPRSPLNTESRFRIATALRDNHQSGAAVVELLRMTEDKARDQRARWQRAADQPIRPKAVPDLHLGSEIDQWIDTLLQFAPLSELERGLAIPGQELKTSQRLREILRARHLAREDFAAAGRFIEPPPSVPAGEPEPEFRPRRFLPESGYPVELAPAAWTAAVDHLARLTQEVRAPSAPNTKAEKLFALAETWSSLRGRLTLPAVDDFHMCNHEFYEAWRQRQRNAQAAGFSPGAAADELENRDEMRHAFRYYLQSADAVPGTMLAARALWRANDAIRRMAELSPWSTARAFETNAAGFSRQLHERLARECPESEEAKRLSVWWSFPPPAELKWMPGDGPSYMVETSIAGAFADGPIDPWTDYRTFHERISQVAATAGTSPPRKLIDDLAVIRRDFLPAFVSARGAAVINHLDDLTLFLQEPGITPSVVSKYFAARLADGPPDTNDPEMQPWRDYLTFLALVREPPVAENRETGERQFRPMSERMREFLDKFPQSRKREAALARLTVSIVRETLGHTGVKSTAWPEAPKLGGYKAIRTKREQPVDARRVFAALDAYTREFPGGRYAGEMRLWHGAAAIDASDWKTAVTLLVATLDDPGQRDLHLDASLHLAGIYMRLLDQPEMRPEIITAIRGNPSAQKRLRQFMKSETLGALLKCLQGYLDQQFATN